MVTNMLTSTKENTEPTQSSVSCVAEYTNNEFGTIRTVTVNGEPYLIANDVAKALGYAVPKDAISRHCKGALKHRCLTDGGEQEVKIIPEGDVYRLIMRSKLPNAEKFEAWVCDEVLPSIRKNGGYIAGQETLSDEELMARALLVAHNKIIERDRIIERQQQKIEADKPKTIFADAVSASDSSMLVRDVAKIIKQNGVPLGEKRFYKWLRDNGYICQNSTSPTQKAMELGLFEIVVRTVERGNGLPIETKTTKVTGKGQQYFINKFLNTKERSA